MAQHLAQGTHANPIDTNRKHISALINAMSDLFMAIDIAPENFAAADLNRLQVSLQTFSQELSKLGDAENWMRITT